MSNKHKAKPYRAPRPRPKPRKTCPSFAGWYAAICEHRPGMRRWLAAGACTPLPCAPLCHCDGLREERKVLCPPTYAMRPWICSS